MLAIALSACGIGALHLVDGDRVESHNLVRQVFYQEDDAHAARFKCDALSAAISKLTGYTEITTSCKYVLSQEDVLSEIANSDFGVLAADRPRITINRWFYRSCRQLEVPGMASLQGILGPLYCPRQCDYDPFDSLERSMTQALGQEVHDDLIHGLQASRPRDYPSDVFGPMDLASAQAKDVIGYVSRAWPPVALGRAVKMT